MNNGLQGKSSDKHGKQLQKADGTEGIQKSFLLRSASTPRYFAYSSARSHYEGLEPLCHP